MILTCSHISKAFGENVLFRDAGFFIEDRGRVAIVGMNGAGKSTLLKILAGELDADGGDVALARGKTCGYLAQYQEPATGMSIYESLLDVKRDVLLLEEKLRHLELDMKKLSGEDLKKAYELYDVFNKQFENANGYAVKSEVTGVLKGLGFSEKEFDKDMDTLSGGEKTRVALGRLLLMKPDLLLLDEPTNHLDVASITWLEGYLSAYPGAIAVVAHDRYFLNRIATRVVEVENGHVDVYEGNYDAYAKKKAAARAALRSAYQKQQQEIKHQEEVIEKLKQFNREKSLKRARSREKQLDRMERLEKPAELSQGMSISFSPSVKSGVDVLKICGLKKAYSGRLLFENLDMLVRRGEHVALIGENGTGKTTILKIINGVETQDDGEMSLGANVHIGYYDQEHHVLHPEKTVFDELSDDFPELTGTELRNHLAAFLFTGDDVFKLVGDLSGGERARVSLAKLMLTEANFLILDEPTNHLDIASREILEDAVRGYEGTVLYVSHDRYFVNRTADRILELTGKNVVQYLGNYDYYLEKKADIQAVTAAQPQPDTNPIASSRADWAGQKEEKAAQRKKQNELKKCEEKIAALEKRRGEIDGLMSDASVATNHERLLELSSERAACDEALEELYTCWESLAESV